VPDPLKWLLVKEWLVALSESAGAGSGVEGAGGVVAAGVDVEFEGSAAGVVLLPPPQEASEKMRASAKPLCMGNRNS